MSLPFLIDDARVRRLAATRQGRVSLGGFAYQAGYAVARLASLRTGRPLLGLPGVPSLLRYDWAEDLDELSAGGRALLTQCKRIADTGKPASLAGILLGFAPKWLWAPADRRPDLRFRLVCPDPRFAGRGAVLLSQLQKDLRRDETLAAAETVLRTPPGRSSDRALWQEAAEGLGFPLLLTALWEQTEVLHLAAEPLPEDPAGPLLLAERWALDLLLRERAIDPARQRPALAALRSLLHGNVVEFDPTAERGALPALDREPRVLGADDVRYALFDVESPPGEEPPFQVVTRHLLDEAAAEPRRSFVARRPQWSDVVHGQDAEVKFLEREQTGPLLARVRDLLASAAEGEPLPALFVLGAPGAGKTTLARRVAARAVQEGLAVVAAPKLNLDRLDEEDVEPFLRALSRLEEGSLPLLLVLDDPLFAESGWDVLLRRLARRSRRVAVLATSPDYLFHQHRHALGRQLDLQTFPLPRPPREEREALAVLHDRAPGLFADRDDDFLVLAMEASAGASFGSIVDRIWITLNGGVPVSPGTRPEDLLWPVRAYLTVCYWHRFGMTCPEVVLRAVLGLAGRDRPAGPAGPAGPAEGFDYELRRLASEHGWAVFGVAEPVKRHLAFLGLQIGAAHRRIAAEAWKRRPVAAFDVGDWLVRSSVEAQPAAVDLGFLACRVESEREPGEPPLLDRLVERWNRAGRDGSSKTRNLCLFYAALSLQGPAAAARRLAPALEACAARQDGQSWLAVLSLLRYPGGRRAAPAAPLPPDIDLPAVIRVADLHQAPGRATQLLSAVQGSPEALAVLLDRIAATADDEKAGHLLSRLVAARPRDEGVRSRAKSWLQDHVGVPGSSELLVQLVEAGPAEPDLATASLAWLADHPTHPNVNRLLVHLIEASPEDPVLRHGEESFRSTGNPRILIALLHAKRTDPRLHNLALDWLGQPRRSGWNGRVMRCLGEALAADPPAAMAFLSHCGDRERRKLVMEALARALQQKPALAAPLTAALPALSPEDLSLLLLHLLRIRSEPLEAFLATWLADPRSRQDDGALLRSIRRKPALRDRLLGRRELDAGVRRELLAGSPSV